MFEKMKKGAALGAFIATVTAFATASIAQEYKIGIQAYKGADVAAREWKPTGEYLTQKLGKTFTVVPLNDKDLIAGVKDGTIDFFFSNPSIYVQLKDEGKAEAIATSTKEIKGMRTEKVASSILVRKDSPITKLADFKGKDFMTRAKSSFAGWLIVKRLFLEKAIDPDRDFKTIQETKSVQHVVYAVLNGAVDGGAVIAGTLEEMAREGKINMDDFRVINKSSADYPFLHSTPLYPEFPMVATTHTPPELRAQVGKALEALTPDDPASKASQVAGWVTPLDYSPVAECMRLVQNNGPGKI
ncbi:MAG: phosphate/phosphite/phosphonate ABC transporter substrate-binding protein [Syntrophobacteraceae bacterium]